MSKILSIGVTNPPYALKQEETMAFARDFFQSDFDNIERLLKVFQNGQIKQRYFSAPLDWFMTERTLQEKNDRYCEMAVSLGIDAINNCLSNGDFLNKSVSTETIDAIILVSTTGMSTPSIEAKIMNKLSFNPHTKRIPIWGLGCAGGTAGLARADDFCRAYPDANVLVLCIELCSLTFQYGDRSKSNLIGTSLFADGVAAVLVTGDQSQLILDVERPVIPHIQGSQTTLMPNSEDVMGWDIRDHGLYVVFSKSIPSLVENWFRPVVDEFLLGYETTTRDLNHFIAHPGGKKVLDAYEKAFKIDDMMTSDSRWVLQEYGNMSSPTVLYVLERAMKRASKPGEKGLSISLGPGFTSELLMLEWESVS